MKTIKTVMIGAFLWSRYKRFEIRVRRSRVREAYIHPAEEVRITFDKQLHTGLNSHDIFNPYVPTVPAFDHNEMILEVKFNRFLPPYIRDLLCTHVHSAQNSAISKYVWCRRFENFE